MFCFVSLCLSLSLASAAVEQTWPIRRSPAQFSPLPRSSISPLTPLVTKVMNPYNVPMISRVTTPSHIAQILQKRTFRHHDEVADDDL